MKMKNGKGVIESGDTLSQIAKKNGMTLKALLGANPNIKNANQIRVGQSITIPPKGMLAGSASSNPYKYMSRDETAALAKDTKANRARLKKQKETGKSIPRDRNSKTNRAAETATRKMQNAAKNAGAQKNPSTRNKNTGSSMSPKLQKLFRDNRR
jgi:LysM repeat protein